MAAVRAAEDGRLNAAADFSMRANRDLTYVIDKLPPEQPIFSFLQEQARDGNFGETASSTKGDFEISEFLPFRIPTKRNFTFPAFLPVAR